MAPEDINDGHAAELWPRCEFGSTPYGEAPCPRQGEVRLDGSLLCAPHTKLVRLKTRESVLLEKVFEMDGWPDEPANRADQPRWRQVLRRRDQAVKLLRSNRKLIETRKEQTP